MNMQKVESSQIHAVGYDAEKKTLRVSFKSGGVYDYADVPEQVHKDMLAAESVGSFFHKNVRGIYQHKKLESAS
ncbi:MAG: KTSC domain-containing protein [Gammaproteobacteria bacterium]